MLNVSDTMADPEMLSVMIPEASTHRQKFDIHNSTTTKSSSNQCVQRQPVHTMWLSVYLLALLQLLTPLCSAATLILRIQPSQLLPNPSILPPSTHATLIANNGTVLRSSLRRDNTIVFPNIVTTGTHLLSIFTKDYTFASYRIDTAPSTPSSSDTTITFAAQVYPGTQWSDTGPSLLPRTSNTDQPSSSSSSSDTSTLTITPKLLAAKTFYTPRPTFSLLALLKSPMILLGIVGVAFAFGMPWLMENMDPEMKKEYEEMQKKGPTAAIGKVAAGGGPVGGFDLAGYLAGSAKGKTGAGSSGSGAERIGAAESLRERKR